jgi:hypothetical protein
MAETASAIITDALSEILVQADEQPVQAVEMQAGIRYMNRMLAEWDANGIALGYTIITNPADPVTVPAGAVEGIVMNLAVRLASRFDEPITPTLAASAKAGMDAVRKLGITIVGSSYGCNLPVGSGNEGDTFNNTHFYPCDEDSNLLTENDQFTVLGEGGNVLLEGGS